MTRRSSRSSTNSSFAPLPSDFLVREFRRKAPRKMMKAPPPSSRRASPFAMSRTATISPTQASSRLSFLPNSKNKNHSASTSRAHRSIASRRSCLESRFHGRPTRRGICHTTSDSNPRFVRCSAALPKRSATISNTISPCSSITASKSPDHSSTPCSPTPWSRPIEGTRWII